MLFFSFVTGAANFFLQQKSNKLNHLDLRGDKKGQLLSANWHKTTNDKIGQISFENLWTSKPGKNTSRVKTLGVSGIKSVYFPIPKSV
jgi:hypothetical protein